MNTRINVEQEVQTARKHLQLPFIIIMVVGVLIPACLWLFSFRNLENVGSRDFLKYLMLILAILVFVVVGIKLILIQKRSKIFRVALTKYANLAEEILVPEAAFVTKCLIPDVGRFAFDTIPYYFWKDNSELIFFPVRPNYFTCLPYHLVSSVRLDEQMVRSYYVIGEEFFETKGIPVPKRKDDIQSVDPKTGMPKSFEPEVPASTYSDTRATIIAYAVGDQTIYLTFDYALFEQLKKIIPDKNKEKIDAQEKKELVESLVPVKEESVEKDNSSQIEELQQQLDNGTINESEFEEQKRNLLEKE